MMVYVVTLWDDIELTSMVKGVYQSRADADAAIATYQATPNATDGDSAFLYDIHEMPLEGKPTSNPLT